ncbi:phospholipase D-like domain-containing protein [Methylobacterium sp. ID0610]|uniref:phospholipase D-like domain-containing protein n=1 Tax=Methylobacterium carpenticola TaxID=3344827 RepID=UPI0036C7C9E3
MTDIPVSPRATARLVVTMPPAPSRLGDALAADIASDYVALTRTTDAFRHLALLARERFTIMVPYIDVVGAEWASQLFEETAAAERIFIVRDASQISSCGQAGTRLTRAATRIIDYGGADQSNETFHAKIVLADGIAAYVGSANMLRRSMSTNLECGMLVEGPAVGAVRVLVNAVASMAG